MSQRLTVDALLVAARSRLLIHLSITRGFIERIGVVPHWRVNVASEQILAQSPRRVSQRRQMFAAVEFAECTESGANLAPLGHAVLLDDLLFNRFPN